ncbi:hypothetical protein [Janthinobacterium fluminis]|uniref:Protein FliT n=1 Tax=Janthinobacterium fluminis TaxID=2987524 RepID=A0ABT5JV93_9BURK|nr:hypothetical protein [Janthinobacterium fluminis]MDC8756494.1 hypothetical protein [Janthinobacterium fluminis]
MPRRPAIERWTLAVRSAGAEADWDALAAACASLARELPLLAARGAWSDAERAALQQLRAAHAQAFQICSDEKERLGAFLGDMQANKEGRLAYALIGDTDSDGI